mmetsp:Transcript_37125/g.6619  ORF Transcript_37125/g.6619 Transcript_37125/m.6619 type:complete len:80 (+) Transcript_37125:383-622(+)
MSIMSFCKIHAYINIDPVVLKYRSNEKLCERMANYSVKIGFGMHYGWAIQGALGSAFKIDASYLSPHVNITMQLEGTTK